MSCLLRASSRLSHLQVLESHFLFTFLILGEKLWKALAWLMSDPRSCFHSANICGVLYLFLWVGGEGNQRQGESKGHLVLYARWRGNKGFLGRGDSKPVQKHRGVKWEDAFGGSASSSVLLGCSGEGK